MVYEVVIVAYKTVVVEAEDEQDAIDLVSSEALAPYGWEVDEITIDNELESDEEIEASISNGADDLRD